MKQLPQQLLQSLQGIKGFDEASFIAAHQQPAAVTSVRFNPAKIDAALSPGMFPFTVESKVPWSANGYYLTERPSFTLDPLFHAGAYYVQEASSMFLEEALRQTLDLEQPLKVLDLCAAPGGKSTLIQSLLNADSFLVSNEVIKTRVTILAENTTKWGCANVVVTNNDPKDFQRLENYFDVIVVDAPCSGSGLFRKDAAAIEEWSENNVVLCAQRQQRILTDVLPALKEGGVLIYSTCSYSEPEDEAIADWLVQDHGMQSLPLQTMGDWNITASAAANTGAQGYRFYPDKVKGEGFFIAAFKKQLHSAAATTSRKAKERPGTVTAAEKEVLHRYLKNADGCSFLRQQDVVLIVPQCLQAELPVLQSALYIKKAGVSAGTIIRNELVPDHELAVSVVLNDAVAKLEVDTDTALQYLRRQDIKPATSLRGWVLLTCHNLALGWMKVLPNRINNYYPAAWRIVNK